MYFIAIQEEEKERETEGNSESDIKGVGKTVGKQE